MIHVYDLSIREAPTHFDALMVFMRHLYPLHLVGDFLEFFLTLGLRFTPSISYP